MSARNIINNLLEDFIYFLEDAFLAYVYALRPSYGIVEQLQSRAEKRGRRPISPDALLLFSAFIAYFILYASLEGVQSALKIYAIDFDSNRNGETLWILLSAAFLTITTRLLMTGLARETCKSSKNGPEALGYASASSLILLALSFAALEAFGDRVPSRFDQIIGLIFVIPAYPLWRMVCLHADRDLRCRWEKASRIGLGFMASVLLVICFCSGLAFHTVLRLHVFPPKTTDSGPTLLIHDLHCTLEEDAGGKNTSIQISAILQNRSDGVVLFREAESELLIALTGSMGTSTQDSSVHRLPVMLDSPDVPGSIAFQVDQTRVFHARALLTDDLAQGFSPETCVQSKGASCDLVGLLVNGEAHYTIDQFEGVDNLDISSACGR